MKTIQTDPPKARLNGDETPPTSGAPQRIREILLWALRKDRPGTAWLELLRTAV